MTLAPAGWGFTGEIEAALDTPRRAGARQVAASRHRSAQIAYWLGRIGYVPEVHEIITRWHVSRCTAFRWRAFALTDGKQFSLTDKGAA